MDINNYEKSKNFERNRAIYVLHTEDGVSFDQLALNFGLGVEEIESILATHFRYEARMK